MVNLILSLNKFKGMCINENMLIYLFTETLQCSWDKLDILNSVIDRQLANKYAHYLELLKGFINYSKELNWSLVEILNDKYVCEESH